MLQEFLVKVQAAKEVLLGELVTRASDPVILKRRFRMLSQLALYESIVVSKIYNLETEDNSDFLNLSYIKHINTIIDKSA